MTDKGCDYVARIFDEDDGMTLFDFIVPKLKRRWGVSKSDAYFNAVVPRINSGAFRSDYFMRESSLTLKTSAKMLSELTSLFYNSLMDY